MESLISLNAFAYTLQCVLANVTHAINGGGVPLMLVNTVFNTSKGMIIGGLKGSGTVGDDDDEEIVCKEDLSMNVSQETQRREAGWIIFEGLLHLGNQWMGTRLSMFFKLLNVRAL
jgi:hypothetical protein